MSKKSTIISLVTLFCLVTFGSAFGHSTYLSVFNSKYGKSWDCGVCHYAVTGGGSRNSYGTTFGNVSTHLSNPSGAMDTIANSPSPCNGYTFLQMISQNLYPGGHGSALVCPGATPTPTPTPTPTLTPTPTPSPTPTTSQSGTVPPTFNEFPVPTVSSAPFRITLGPDGNLWFTENSGNKIGRITAGGVITEFPVLTVNSQPLGVISGPDGNLWFTENNGNKIGQISPGGVILNEFLIPTANSQPTTIALGPDGNLWFTEKNGNNIGRITMGGVITEFPIPTANSQPTAIRTGPDGNLWFTENNGNKIGQISPAGVILNEFSIPTSNSQPNGIHNGPDGNLWFCEQNGNRIGKITTAGFITEFLLPFANSNPRVIISGTDGNLWFTVYGTNGNKIDQITTAGVITEFTVPTPSSNPGNITIGPDGNLWFTEQNGNKIGHAINTSGVMPVPSSNQLFTITPPVLEPIINPVSAQAAPIGLGLVAGGNLFSIVIGLGQFSAPVDIYFALYAPAIDPNLLVLTSTGLSSSALAPWIHSSLGNIFVPFLQDIRLSSLPVGTYTLYLAVTPAGSISSYYIWATSFTRP